MASAKTWIQAFRLRTLPLALASIILASFLAAGNHAFRVDIFGLCIATTLFLQILSNLANDYGDSIHGADSLNRDGPSRTVQSGLITANAMRTAMYICGLAAFVCGLLLIYVALADHLAELALFLLLGLAAIYAAIRYTSGKNPYGYKGLGDFFVLVFFGLVGVMCSYYLYTLSWDWAIMLPALSCGFFAVAVLNVNNIRDIKSDEASGKYSIPVRIGRDNAVLYHWLLLSLGVLSALFFVLLDFHSPWQLLFLVTLPLLVKNGIAVKNKTQAQELDPYLKQMALTTLIFVLTFGIGHIVGS